MSNTQFCLSEEILHRIGHDEILPGELRAIEDHVSQCEHCREMFTATTVEPDWTESILPVLRDHSRDLPNTGNQANHGDSEEWTGDVAALSLLGPTDDPRMLGRIGPYEVTGIIGRGGMGVVFKAFDAVNRFVAIKMLLPHLASSGSARKRFSREGQAAAAVIDDHVLPIFGVDEWQGVPYIVMQYSSGTSLQRRIHEQGPLELKEILRIGLQVARGLAAAHAQGLVHRDVKPSNILLDRTVERALLTDFGLARAVDDATITRSGTIAGTPQFMAPEQARGEAIDGRSDLFSMGAVMYAMCTGHPPFRAESSYGVMRRVTDEEPRSIREINPEIPEWSCGIVSKLMAKQAEDRFGSAEEVAVLLEDCLAHVQQPTSVPLPKLLVASASSLNRNGFPRIAKWLATTFGAFLFVLASIVIVLELNKGQVTIRCDADDVPIRIMKGDEVVERLTVADTGTNLRLAAGQYVVELDGAFDGMVVTDGEVSLRRGGNHIVRIVQSATSGDVIGKDIRIANDQLGTVLGKTVLASDLNKNVELREDLVRLFVRPVEEEYLKKQQLDPEEAMKKRIPDDAIRLGALMFVRQRVLHKHLYTQRGGRVLLTAFGPIAYDAYRQWLEEREQAGDFRLNAAEHRELLFTPLDEKLRGRLTEDPETIRLAFDPAATEEFIESMSKMQSKAVGKGEIGPLPPKALVETVQRALARLPTTVRHDFAADGLPAERFTIQAKNADRHVVPGADGIQVSHLGEDGYSSTSIETRMRVHGNFEVTVSFEHFAFMQGDDGSGAIAVTAILDNEAHTHVSVQRGAMIDARSPLRHFVQSEFVHSPKREPGVTWLGTAVEESTSGRLRLARVGETFYCLFAAGDSSEFRMIHSEEVGAEDLLFGGIRLNAGVQSNGSDHATTSVVWKNLTVCALSELPIGNGNHRFGLIDGINDRSRGQTG